MRRPFIVRALQLLGCYCIISVFLAFPFVAMIFMIFWWLMVEILWDTRSNW